VVGYRVGDGTVMGTAMASRRRTGLGRRRLALPRLWLHLVVVASAWVVGASPAQAQVITMAYPSFTSADAAGFALGGAPSPFSAYVPDTADVIRLTDDAGNTAGAAFSKQLIHLPTERSFSTCFTISMPTHASTQYADGMLFVLQSGTTAPLVAGDGMGFLKNPVGSPNSQPHSLAIEFDTFQNTFDPSVPHVGVDLNGSWLSTITAPTPGNAPLYGSPWNVWVDYDGSAKILEVRMSQSASRPVAMTFSLRIDLVQVIGQDVHAGFTAATGGWHEAHDVRAFYFQSSYLPGGVAPSTTSYSTAGLDAPPVDLHIGQINGDVDTNARLGLTVTGTDLHYGSPAQGSSAVSEINSTHTVLTNSGDVASGLYIKGDGPAKASGSNAFWSMGDAAATDAFVWRFSNAGLDSVRVTSAGASDLGTLGFDDSRDFASAIDMPTFSTGTGIYEWSATVWVTAPE